MSEKKESENLSKLASECADKLREIEKPENVRIGYNPPLMPPPIIKIMMPERPWFEDFMNTASATAMIIGFIALGFAFASLIK